MASDLRGLDGQGLEEGEALDGRTLGGEEKENRIH